FGWGGGKPSHPELLDWLATEYMAQAWQAKPIHRLIMLSSTYRQAATFQPQAAARDAQGRWAWRFTPRRLDAEAIRDSLLCASGVLDTRMGGPGYDVFEPNTNYVKLYTPKQTFNASDWRRMVYQEKPRSRSDATFGEFDCPDASQSVSRRNMSTTALQALNLLNSPFILAQATLMAQRVEREAGCHADAQVERAFWICFGRQPDADERRTARQLTDEHGLPALCRALFNANEFLTLD
ncbi:MAG TPA: DUF1553 domain-containing protein, partial [Pirellulales bacterium]|nr:DUF1553 domain-containing protein [Pirellulales bacterium]